MCLHEKISRMRELKKRECLRINIVLSHLYNNNNNNNKKKTESNYAYLVNFLYLGSVSVDSTNCGSKILRKKSVKNNSRTIKITANNNTVQQLFT